MAILPKRTEQLSQKRIWWEIVAIVILVHIFAVATLLFVHPSKFDVWLVLALWVMGCLGITMGYHRLWSHKSYQAVLPVRIILAVFGTMAFQGSIRWWAIRHRLHHRYTDSEHDPYDATRGFWFSHILWMFEKPHYTRLKWVDSSDLDADPVVKFQNKHFPVLSVLAAFVVPTLIGATYGNAFSGYCYGGFVARLLIWHSTWMINSFAHMFGEQEYSNENTSRGNLFLAFMTFGEGHHNYVFWLDAAP